MRVTFVAFGWENIAIEHLSAYLKSHGHECSLAYDQCLFDDKNYLCMPFLASLLDDPSSVVEQVLSSRPQLVAFSVMTVQFERAAAIAKMVKAHLDRTPILFGGYHPTLAPDAVLREEAVDMVCVGEGEHALLELVESMDAGKAPSRIAGIWYKDEGGNIVRTGPARSVADLDSLPYVDKELFAGHIPMGTYLLSSLGRGCIYNCTYCSVTALNELARKGGVKPFRLPSVERAIAELRQLKDKFGYRWIDFRHAIFASSSPWILQFCEKYKTEIGVPFRIFMHPALVEDEDVRALVDAGCFTIQMGVESFDEDLRRKALGRYETNDQILRAIDTLEKNGAKYTLDYMLGLPGQTEGELKEVARLMAGLKHCYRLSPFMCQYLPASKLIAHAASIGELKPSDIERIEKGKHDNYMAEGSIAIFDEKRQKTLRAYRVLFRALGLVPRWMRRMLLSLRILSALKAMPPWMLRTIIKLMDIPIVVLNRDARGYFLNYAWWLSRRLIPSHPTFIFRRKRLARTSRYHTTA